MGYLKRSALIVLVLAIGFFVGTVAADEKTGVWHYVANFSSDSNNYASVDFQYGQGIIDEADVAHTLIDGKGVAHTYTTIINRPRGVGDVLTMVNPGVIDEPDLSSWSAGAWKEVGLSRWITANARYAIVRVEVNISSKDVCGLKNPCSLSTYVQFRANKTAPNIEGEYWVNGMNYIGDNRPYVFYSGQHIIPLRDGYRFDYLPSSNMISEDMGLKLYMEGYIV